MSIECLVHTLSASLKRWGILHALAGPQVTQRGVSHLPSSSAAAPESTGLQTEKCEAEDFQGPFLSWLQWVRHQESTKLSFFFIIIISINTYTNTHIYICILYISQGGHSLPSASCIFQSFYLKSTGPESSLSFNEGWASCGLRRQQEVLLTEKPRMVGDFDNITRVGSMGRRLWIKLSDLLGPSAFYSQAKQFLWTLMNRLLSLFIIIMPWSWQDYLDATILLLISDDYKTHTWGKGKVEFGSFAPVSSQRRAR